MVSGRLSGSRMLVGAVVVVMSVVLSGCSVPRAGGARSVHSPAATQVSQGALSPGTARRPVMPGFVVEAPSAGWRVTSSGGGSFGIAPGTRPAAPVEGYANQTSVADGGPVQLFVSTSAGRWRASAYRMGWYGGKQAALVWRSGWLPGLRQPRARTVGKTLTPVARWRRSLTVASRRWRPGSYLIRLETASAASYIPLTVRSPSARGRLVLLAPDTTWQAYNDWGGRNLYWGPKGKGDYAHRARAVTFDRPYAYGEGSGEFLGRMLPVVVLAERLKLPLAYADDVDLERDPHLLEGARGVISMGHDEYYSVGMRTALERARDAGTNIGFLGANAVFRRIRFGPTDLGRDRLEVNYKDPNEDPLTRSRPRQTTADWPAAPQPDPESSLTGEAYACFPGSGDLIVSDPSSWLFAGTGLRKGDKLPHALGPEFDAVDPGMPKPHPLDVMMRSPVHCGRYQHADATYYTAPSGAGVFDAGTMGWVAGLAGRDGWRTQQLEQRITTTLLHDFATAKAGRTHSALGH